MIKLKLKTIERYMFESKLKEHDCKTKEDVLDLLFGNYNNDYTSNYYVKEANWENAIKESFINRLNCLWVYPLFVMIAPFRYLMFGNYRVDENSKFGKAIEYFIGEYR